jgi:Zn finger protein HypA/HybF involved in hydrogenase expression
MSQPGLEVADVFRRHGEAWREANAGHVSAGQLRVMSAIEACRTAALGGHVERCEDCAHVRIAYNSCGNRHCPKCQSRAAAAWLAARQAELLPVPYYHVVFTLPAPIGAIAYQNTAKVYALLFKAAAETLMTIAADPKHLGADIGVTAVLHTWGQTLDHHPHLHCIVPGGGLSPDGGRWIACRPGFFLPVRVLSRLFRRLFLEGLEAAHRAGEFIRRFLMHTLPDGFHRIRHYGLFANGHRADKLGQCRRLLEVPIVETDAATAPMPDNSDGNTTVVEESHACPCCGGRMVTIETFEACYANSVHARYAIRLDSS